MSKALTDAHERLAYYEPPTLRADCASTIGIGDTTSDEWPSAASSYEAATGDELAGVWLDSTTLHHDK